MELDPRFFLELHLNPSKGDPRELIRRETEWLPTGSGVRIHTHKVSPIPFSIPFVTQPAVQWIRLDIHFEFLGEDLKTVSEWANAVKDAKAAIL
jgi:hypothetical protein